MHVLKNARLKLQREKLAVMEVSHEKEISDMLLNSMARIVDRYALCDIENDTYEYHERQTRGLYPECGSYRDLVEAISNRYRLFSEDENKKIFMKQKVVKSLLKCWRTKNDLYSEA